MWPTRLHNHSFNQFIYARCLRSTSVSRYLAALRDVSTLLQRVRQHGADSERHLGADPAPTDDCRRHSGLPETHSAGHQQPPDIPT